MTESDVGGEIRLGSALFTLVEPHRGHEVAYNRWYERDHFNAGCMVGPWLYAGRRWVATRALKDLRFGAEPDLFGRADLGSYLAVYFVIDGKHDAHFSWALRQVQWLHANDRMFAERDHVHTLLYRYLGEVAADPQGVPPELALDHPYAGLVATVVEHGDGDGSVAMTPLADVPSLALAFAPIPLPEGAPVTQQGLTDLDRRTLVLTFLAGNPVAAWPGHRSACAGLEQEHPGARVLWSAPFIPTVPGTDRYTDELW